MRIIAGPCQHESLESSLNIAQHCSDVCKRAGIEYIFKASYDKANRTSIKSIRGCGMQATMNDFVELKNQIPDLKILTDFHSASEIVEWNTVDAWVDAVDVIQIPALLCRQTDIIRAACNTNKIVNIKKGQFVAPWDVNNIVDKAWDANELWITERGTSFGYNNIVVDYTGIMYMLNRVDADIVFDVTHSVQKPGGHQTSSGGNSNYVRGLARSGSALGITSFFMEVHPMPSNAPSDGDCMLKLSDFERTVDEINRYNYTR
jgi:2-dehydro-3-deoxyphosphooctonate aldolase (KDO 8-P synthase)